MTNNNHAPWAPEPMAAASSTCVHQYEFRILGGHPITVPLCMLCGNPGWSDLRQQAVELYRWGWEEGRAGEAARTALSAYDRPSREAGEPGEQPARTTVINPATGRDAVNDQLRVDANTWRHKAIRRALAISKLRGTIDATVDLADQPVTDPTPWGDGYRAAIEDLREVLREFGQREAPKLAAGEWLRAGTRDLSIPDPGPCPGHADLRTTQNNSATSSDAADNPMREELAAAVENEIYEYRERTMFWQETGGVTEEIAKVATRGAMKAVEHHLDIGEEQAWCKTCRRVWESRSHRCESDAEQRLTRTREIHQEACPFAKGELNAAFTCGMCEALADGPASTTASLREHQARPNHPDGTPYRYHEIVAEGWGFCDACRMWSTGTVEQPHQCRGAAVRAVSDDDGPSVAEAAADDRRWDLEKEGS